ncbi:MAG: Calx-beta domain-containing protein, partial [Methylococcaceae bacterium]
GTQEQQITIPIIGDTQQEPDETFNVKLSTPQSATVSATDSTATVTIIDDDVALPTVSISTPGVQVDEGSNGINNYAVIPVKLSQASSQTVSVNFSTLDGLAKAGSDYQPVTVPLIFNPGVTYQEIRIPIVGDNVAEADETFQVVLNSAQHASVGGSPAQVTIRNDDVPIVFIQGNRQTPIVVNEGGVAQVTVHLSQALRSTVSVNYATKDWNDASTALAGSDYQPMSGTLTFQPGETVKTLQIPTKDDTSPEGLERFSVELSASRFARLPTPEDEATLNGSASREIDIQDNDSSFGGFRYYLFNGKWYNSPQHTQSVAVSTVAAALKGGPTTIQIDGLDAPSVIQINGWTPDDKLVFNTQKDDAQKRLGAATSEVDTNLSVLFYGRHYTTTKTNSFGSTSQLQRVTGVMWTTTSKGTNHWIMYGTADPSQANTVSPEWVDGLDKTLAKIVPAQGVYGEYIKASDISFI